MELGRVKDIVGFALVGLHLLAMFLCFVWLRERMSLQSFQITILILSPVTATYSLAYLREVVRTMFGGTREYVDKQAVTVRFAILSFLFTFTFSCVVIYTLYSFSFSQIEQSADDLKLSLSIIETSLGAFIGLIVETLFGKTINASDNPVERNLSSVD
jgi:uncharacterized protein YacL